VRAVAEKKDGMRLLGEIEPPGSARRFLQNWDPDTRVVRFGCGDGKVSVQVGSDGTVDAYEGSASPTKLQRRTAQRFLEGEAAKKPLSDIQQILRQYLHFRDPRQYALLSTWIMGTYVYSIFSHFGYLFLYSAQKRCGKTRAEEITSHLAFEGTPPRNAPTPPSMRETAVAGGTAIFDTLERWKEKGHESFSAAMDLLDAGFRNGGVVTKMVTASNGDWRLESYPVYAPYMFAAIERESLTDTARDRSFEIEMVRKSTRLKTRPYDRRCELECEPIRENLYFAAWSHAAQIANQYESLELQCRVDALGLNDRAGDIWKPLLAVALGLGEDEIAQLLCQLAREMSPDPDRQEEMRQLSLVRSLRTLTGPDGVVTGTTQQILEMLRTVTSGDFPDLHTDLSALGFAEKSMRLNDFDTPRKAWEITDADLAIIEASLVGGSPSEMATTTTTTESHV
jgi:hypothetical protein